MVLVACVTFHVATSVTVATTQRTILDESCDHMNARESLSAIPQRILRYQFRKVGRSVGLEKNVFN